MQTYTLDNTLKKNSLNGKLYKQFIGNKLIKTSSINEAQFGISFKYEAIGEYISYKVCKYLNIPENLITPYKLCKVHIDNGIESIDTIGCECSLFTEGGEKFISFYKLINSNHLSFTEMLGRDSYSSILETYKLALGNEREEHIIKFLNTMFLIDSLILNSDRHLGNFGFIANKAGYIIREAPIFDNGNSLFCHKPFTDLEYDASLNRYIFHRPIHRDFDFVFNTIDIHNSYIDTSKLSTLVPYIKELCTSLVNNGIIPKSRSDFMVSALQSRVDILSRIQKL